MQPQTKSSPRLFLPFKGRSPGNQVEPLLSLSTVSLQPSHSRGTKPPRWRAKFALGQDKQRKLPFKIMLVFCLSCPSATFALQLGGFVPREWLAAKRLLVKWNLSYLECWCYKGLQVQVRGVQGLIHRSFSLHHVPSQLMGKKKKPHWQVICRLTKKKHSPLRRSWWSFYKRHKRKYHQTVLLNVRVKGQHLVEIAWLWTFCITHSMFYFRMVPNT